MATLIEQHPLYPQLPVGQDVVYVVSNNSIVAGQLKVKFIAKVHISSGMPPDISTGDHLIGTFKTTPNNAGVGMFNFRNIVENYVKPDNMAANGSAYKGTTTNAENQHPIHLIDRFSKNKNAIRYLRIEFGIEYLGATDCNGDQDSNVVREACGETKPSDFYLLFNAYLKYTDTLTVTNNDFGYDIDKFLPNSASDKFLSNMPSEEQYATLDDYGTCAFLALNGSVDKIVVEVYGDVYALIEFDKTSVTGAYNAWDAHTDKNLLYFGCYPANLRQNFTFDTLKDGITYYDVYAVDSGGSIMAGGLTIHILCPDGRGYDPIRLTWLNQWGVWDYFTFNKKSVKSLSTKGTTYDQLEGTWNEGFYRADSYKGGKKSFRVNATEKIKINTDYIFKKGGHNNLNVSEDYNVAFEELMNSPEVYILDGFQTDISNSLLNQYVTPVRLLSRNFTTKTVANDKLIQYTFEIEKTKTLRTQSV